MLQDLEPVQGEVRQSRMCKVGVYNQHSCDQLAKDVRLANPARNARLEKVPRVVMCRRGCRRARR